MKFQNFCLIFQYFFVNSFAFNDYSKWKLLDVPLGAKNSSHRPEILKEIERWKSAKIIHLDKDKIKIGTGPRFQSINLEKLKKKFNLEVNILHDDISRLISEVHFQRKRALPEDDFDRYMNYEKMEEFFSLLETTYPDVVERKIIGKSYEGRNISLFIISSKNNPNKCQPQTRLQDTNNWLINKRNYEGDPQNMNINQNNRQVEDTQSNKREVNQQNFDRFAILRPRRQRQNERAFLPGNDTHYFHYLKLEFLNAVNRSYSKLKKRDKLSDEKPVIFIDAGLHSREWICPAVALYLIKQLAESPSLISSIDWFIIPLANPDGYKFSWNGDRFWRKTRSKSGTSGCYGADMNRNFDIYWGEVDTSKNPCSEHYGGTGANSEIETVVVRDILIKEKHRLKAYISLHNWGQQILYPYSYDQAKVPRSENEMNRIGKGMVHEIKKSQNADYHTGRGSVMLYPASGTSIDWAYDVLGIPYSYLIELRDSLGLLGFLLPESLIKPTGEDTFAAMKYLAKEIQKSQNNSCHLFM